MFNEALLIKVLKTTGAYDFLVRRILRNISEEGIHGSMISAEITEACLRGLEHFNQRNILLKSDIRILIGKNLKSDDERETEVVMNDLLDITETIEHNSNNNAMSRRSQSLKAIRSYIPNIGKAEGNYLIEALLQLHKN